MNEHEEKQCILDIYIKKKISLLRVRVYHSKDTHKIRRKGIWERISTIFYILIHK